MDASETHDDDDDDHDVDEDEFEEAPREFSTPAASLIGDHEDTMLGEGPAVLLAPLASHAAAVRSIEQLHRCWCRVGNSTRSASASGASRCRQDRFTHPGFAPIPWYLIRICAA